jgi:hypothetical protein
MNKILLSLVIASVATSAQTQNRGPAKLTVENTSSITSEFLPDAPEPRGDQSFPSSGPLPPSPQSSTTPQQTSRILGIIPNFRAVSADSRLPPQTAREKLKVGLQDSFDYSSLILVGVQAGAAQAGNTYPTFRQGASGFGRYYWHAFADQADENLWVESILPIALHQDSRYYTLGRGSFIKRAGYALTRTVITRKDNGGETFNAAEIVGAGAASGISSTYYPGQYRTWTKTGQRWLSNVLVDSATMVARSFGLISIGRSFAGKTKASPSVRVQTSGQDSTT